MRRKRNEGYRKKGLKGKVVLLILGIVLLACLIVFQQQRRNTKEAAYEKTVGQERRKEQEETQKVQEIKTKAAKEEAAGKSKTQAQKTRIPITNLEESAAEVLGKQAYLLEERLTEWVKEEQSDAEGGSIFHVSVPLSDPQSICFYVKLADERGSLVLLSYHPREKLVTASRCSYTQEEVKAEVWEDNGPAQRDVPEEQDTGGTNGQEETDDAAGEA